MTLTIERLHPSRGINNIKITQTRPDKPIKYFFLTQDVLREFVFWSRWYSDYRDAYDGMGCYLKSGEVTHVG